jgi:siroheme synthase-like protein
MPFGYPVSLELAGRRCLVIGGEAVRAGKVEGLLAGGADDVVVLADAPAAKLDELGEIEGVRVERRGWRDEDFDGAFLVVASATSGDGARIAAAARRHGVLVNVMDDVENCDWAAPSVVRRGELVVAIATGGSSPALARRLREHLESELGPEWAEALVVLRRVREETLPLLPDLRTRAERWSAALDLDEISALVRSGQADELERRLRDRLLRKVRA